MANIVYGPYAQTSWSGATAINITRLNNLETSASVALNGINPLLSGPFVYSGIACTKDGTNANQLDIASGVAFITMSDGSTGQIVVSADNTHTTSTPSTTYYLFLKNDGAWQWSTTSTGPTNSLPICQATTDGSGNISAVTDVRHTGGSPGVPYVVGRVLNTAVSATTDQVVLSITTPIRGLYRCNCWFFYSNATPQKVTATYRWYDPNVGAFTSASPTIASTGAIGQIQNGSQANNTGNNQSVSCLPMVAFAEAGQLMTFHFQDPGGTPACKVSVVFERIA